MASPAQLSQVESGHSTKHTASTSPRMTIANLFPLPPQWILLARSEAIRCCCFWLQRLELTANVGDSLSGLEIL